MIPLERQVCSLGHARKLRDLGVAQESAFYWINCLAPHPDEWIVRSVDYGYSAEMMHRRVAAFTVAELGLLLDYRLPTLDCGNWLVLWHGVVHGYADTETNARAMLLIHLLESKILTVDEVNRRLKS